MSPILSDQHLTDAPLVSYHRTRVQAGHTYVFRPDSVEALTPKKYASMAEMLPYGSNMRKPERPARMIYKSVDASMSSSETMSNADTGVLLTVKNYEVSFGYP